MLKFYPFLILSVLYTNAQTCTTTCPSGGIWSEWTTTEKCSTTCGACTRLNYKRTCLSSEMKNCPCSGSSTSSQLCNTQACNYPRANGPGLPCCFGLTPTIVNNWYFCVNSTQPAVSTPCCPTGGIWGEWTDWIRTEGQAEWSRSRKCVSKGFNCACSGETEQTKNDCPCTPMTAISPASNPCASLTRKTLYSYREPLFIPSTCQMRFALETSNFRHQFYFTTNGVNSCTTGYVDETGKCKLAEFQTGNLDTNGQFWFFAFLCDPVTLKWNRYYRELGLNMTGVTQLGQFYLDA